MVQLIFITGRNWQFSLCELTFVLEHLCPDSRIVLYSKCACLVEFPQKDVNEVPIETLQFYLGGIQKIALVTGQYSLHEFAAAFPLDMDSSIQLVQSRSQLTLFLKQQIPRLFGPVQKGQYFVAHSFYPDTFNSEFYRSSIQHILPYLNQTTEDFLRKSGATKVDSYRYPQEPLLNGSLNPIFPHHVLRYKLLTPNRAEIIWAIIGTTIVVGRTFAVSDPNYLKELDEGRPFHRFEGTIPPKFAKAMLNFAIQGFKSTKKQPVKIFDPFCGSGTFLMFGLLFELDVFGSDADPACVEGTQSNLAWFCKKENLNARDWSTRVKQTPISTADVNFPGISPNAIVTEPFLLPHYREAPADREIKQVYRDTTIPGYIHLFDLALRILPSGGRLCTSFPVAYGTSGDAIPLFPLVKRDIPHALKPVALPTNFEEPGFNPPADLSYGIIIRQKHQFVSREIFLFEKA